MRIVRRLALLAPFLLVAVSAQEAATPSATPAAAPNPAPAAAPTATSGPVWLTDFEQAKAAAKKDGKAIVAAFVGSDWCGYSMRMQKEVFDKPAFGKVSSGCIARSRTLSSSWLVRAPALT